MQRDIILYLEHILDSCEYIQEITSGVSLDDFMENRMLRNAVERNFEIIGEALNQASKADPRLREQILDFQNIVGFRNVLSHGYFVVEEDVVYSTAIDYLPNFSRKYASFVRLCLEIFCAKQRRGRSRAFPT